MAAGSAAAWMVAELLAQCKKETLKQTRESCYNATLMLYKNMAGNGSVLGRLGSA